MQTADERILSSSRTRGGLLEQIHSRAWIAFVLLTLVIAEGTMLVALADTGARASQPWAPILFWIGLLIIFTPVMARLAWPDLSRAESVSLVVALGLALYLVKVLHSPLAFTQHDEFFHARTYYDIMQSGHLFTPNPLLPITAVYPAMEVVTSALSSLTGLSLFPAGVLLIGIARVILLLGLYLFFEGVSRSARVAGIATALYMTNPNFLFFDAMYKYEVFALGCAGMVLFAVVRGHQAQVPGRWRWLLLAALGLFGVVTSHHLTSYAVVGLLFIWGVVALVRHEPSARWILGVAALGAAMIAGWFLFVAPITLNYLWDPLGAMMRDINRLREGDPSGGRALFQSAAGNLAPPLERIIAVAAAGLLLAGLPFGLIQLWRRFRTRAVGIVLGLGALLYPATLVLRLVRRGWEISNRSSEFIFVPLAFVLALAVVYMWLSNRAGWRWLALTAAASIVLLGGVIAGWPPEWRLPGPYLPEADTRSVDREGVAAAQWASSYLGPDNMFAADRTNHLLMGSYGGQNVSEYVGGLNVDWMILARSFAQTQLGMLRQGSYRYVVVDERVLSSPRVIQSYYPNLLPGQAIDKFDSSPGVSCVFDSGAIKICDVGGLSHAR